MTRQITEITEEEFELSKSEFVRSVGQQTVLIQRDGEAVAVLMSPELYETTQEAKTERAIKVILAAKEAAQEQVQSIATPEELLNLDNAFGRMISRLECSKKLTINASHELIAPLETQEQPSLLSPRSFPSMHPDSREALRSYQVRLQPSTIRELEKLKADQGVVPAHFIRDAVESALAQLHRSTQ